MKMTGWDQIFPSNLKSQTSISKWPSSPEKKILKISLKQTLIDFCRESSIHGIKYLVEPNQHWLEKVFWIASLAFGNILSQILKFSIKKVLCSNMVPICASVSSCGKILENKDHNKRPDNKLSHFRDRFPRHLRLLQHPSVQLKIRGRH